MKKILITRKLIKESEDKASKTFDPIFNSNDELYSQSKVIEMSQGCDGILSPLTDKMDKETINKFCLLYTSPSPRDRTRSRMPSSA